MKNDIHRRNLQKLATFLAYGELPKDVRFNMKQFTEGDEFAPICETAGCAIGFAPFAGIQKFETERFLTYSIRTLISNTKKWNWCFHLNWCCVDNTPLGAAKRIQYLLANGIDEWDGECNFKAVELYKDVEVKS